MSYEEVEKMATDTGIFEKSEISAAVQFLHELGTLQHFNNEYLKDKVVVDPQWIVDVMACVVSVKDSPIKVGTACVVSVRDRYHGGWSLYGVKTLLSKWVGPVWCHSKTPIIKVGGTC